MEKVYYKTSTSLNGKVTDTPCIRRKNFGYNVGSRFCLSCSYCYDINVDEKYVMCIKKVKS